jgi:glucose/arabinose dehydrogenase
MTTSPSNIPARSSVSRWAFLLAASLHVCAPAAWGQIRTDLYVSGLNAPLAFVQDPSDRDVQYIVEQGGRIRVVRDGSLEATDFLNITSAVSSGGERGLLGLAFPPDYAASGRFYVNFTNAAAGNTVIARFRRSAGNPLVADPATRFDLRWPDGNRYITQPFSNHNGGTLAFGPDGYLYIGLGDGGSGNDPDHRAQDPTTLLGKMLRVNVNVADSDAEGYDVPPDNPFVDSNPIAALHEIWAFGLRNPWKFSFDHPARGGTGALIIGDVGQSSWEEIDYEPSGQGGRNYGWRNREGAHDNVVTRSPAYTPLVDPIWEYDHSVGNSITGGFVYRGALLGAAFRGRYFYADIVGRVWSLALTIDPATGEAVASDQVEHTSALGGAAALGLVSSFGVDADGELYVVNLTGGTVLKVSASGPLMHIDSPTAGTFRQPFNVTGWAIDPGAVSGSGVDAVHVWAFPAGGGAAVFVGEAAYGRSRPDVGAAFGSRFTNSGFDLVVRGVRPGVYQLIAYARSTVTGTFNAARAVAVTINGYPQMALDTPRHGERVLAPFSIEGWALDWAAATGPGVDAVHVWAVPLGPPRLPAVFLGEASYGVARPDVGAGFGPAFTNSGFNFVVRGLRPGQYQLAVYAHSAVSGVFDNVSTITVDVRSSVQMFVDIPTAGSVLTRPFQVSGWALDQSAVSDTGVDAIHIWAFPTTGRAPVFVGAAAYGGSRPDVGAAFGTQFTNSAFNVSVSGLSPGVYDLVVYARSSVTGSFSDARVVRVTVK